MGANSHVVARSREVRAPATTGGPKATGRPSRPSDHAQPSRYQNALNQLYSELGPGMASDEKNARATGGLP